MDQFIFHFNCGCIVSACAAQISEEYSKVACNEPAVKLNFQTVGAFGALAIAYRINRENHPVHADTKAHAYEHRGYLIFMN